jgi:hypothetical protein
MAARSRPRGGQRTDEYDEERVIWNSIKQDGRRVDQLLVWVNFVLFNTLVMQHLGKHRIISNIIMDEIRRELRELRDTEGYQSHDKLAPKYGRRRNRENAEELAIWEDIKRDGRRVDACMV